MLILPMKELFSRGTLAEVPYVILTTDSEYQIIFCCASAVQFAVKALFSYSSLKMIYYSDTHDGIIFSETNNNYVFL